MLQAPFELLHAWRSMRRVKQALRRGYNRLSCGCHEHWLRLHVAVPVYKPMPVCIEVLMQMVLPMYQCSMQYLASAAFALRMAVCSNSAAASSTLCPEAAFSSGDTGLLVSLLVFPVSTTEAAGGEAGPLASDAAACSSGFMISQQVSRPRCYQIFCNVLPQGLSRTAIMQLEA